jgi:hypothetical protein
MAPARAPCLESAVLGKCLCGISEGNQIPCKSSTRLTSAFDSGPPKP